MPRRIAFLRAINVGGHVVKMDHLRKLLASFGFENVDKLMLVTSPWSHAMSIVAAVVVVAPGTLPFANAHCSHAARWRRVMELGYGAGHEAYRVDVRNLIEERWSARASDSGCGVA